MQCVPKGTKTELCLLLVPLSTWLISSPVPHPSFFTHSHSSNQPPSARQPLAIMSCNKKLYKFIACLWQGENEEPEAVAIFYVLSQTKDGMPVWEPQDGRNDLRLKERIEGGDWFTAGFGGFENGKVCTPTGYCGAKITHFFFASAPR